MYHTLGHDYARMETFNTLMNIPNPLAVKNYNKTVSKTKKVVKTVAEETFDDAAIKEIHDSAASADYILNTGVPGDNTWQRKGFSSFNGVFAAIYVESGKVLDLEPMSRYWKDCISKKDLKVKNATA